ncbi:hypothetical protein PALU110988_00615 [Paenibacillus lupini]|uniref:hypothetical protein n=1 Tax=Paenibacillus lupini TaxID=1450204 RepID=UPI001420C856|nr:hypothetical protein [Paenibacillus lupini]NIK23672.1 hypothetical protein [Paenibacillus lupini]
MKIGMITILFIVILLSACGNGNDTKGANDTNGVSIAQGTEDKLKQSNDTVTSRDASWPFNKMIKFQDRIYVGSDEKVESVDGKIGSIKQLLTEEVYHEDDETSNYYKEGTGLYQITGAPVESAIAVEAAPGQYVRAVPVQDMLGGGE